MEREVVTQSEIQAGQNEAFVLFPPNIETYTDGEKKTAVSLIEESVVETWLALKDAGDPVVETVQVKKGSKIAINDSGRKFAQVVLNSAIQQVQLESSAPQLKREEINNKAEEIVDSLRMRDVEAERLLQSIRMRISYLERRRQDLNNLDNLLGMSEKGNPVLRAQGCWVAKAIFAHINFQQEGPINNRDELQNRFNQAWEDLSGRYSWNSDKTEKFRSLVWRSVEAKQRSLEVRDVYDCLDTNREAWEGPVKEQYPNCNSAFGRWQLARKLKKELSPNNEIDMEILILELGFLKDKENFDDSLGKISALNQSLKKQSLLESLGRLDVFKQLEFLHTVMSEDFNSLDLGALVEELIEDKAGFLDKIRKIPVLGRIFPKAEKIRAKLKKAVQIFSVLSLVFISKSSSIIPIPEVGNKTVVVGQEETQTLTEPYWGEAPDYSHEEVKDEFEPEVEREEQGGEIEEAGGDVPIPMLSEGFLVETDLEIIPVIADNGDTTLVVDFGPDADYSDPLVTPIDEGSRDFQDRGLFSFIDPLTVEVVYSSFQVPYSCDMHAVAIAVARAMGEGQRDQDATLYINPYVLAKAYLYENPNEGSNLLEVKIKETLSNHPEVSNEVATRRAANLLMQTSNYREWLRDFLGINILPIPFSGVQTPKDGSLVLPEDVYVRYGGETSVGKEDDYVEYVTVPDEEQLGIINEMAKDVGSRISGVLESGDQVNLGVQSSEHCSHSLIVLGVEVVGEEVLLRVVEGRGNDQSVGPMTWGVFNQYNPQIGSDGTTMVISLNKIFLSGGFKGAERISVDQVDVVWEVFQLEN